MAKILIGLYIVLTSSALIALKLGAKFGAPISFVNHKMIFNINPYVAGGIFLYGTSFLFYTYLLSRYDLGYIIPLTTAFVYVLIFFASFVIFKESFTLTKIVGIALVLCGIIFLNIKN